MKKKYSIKLFAHTLLIALLSLFTSSTLCSQDFFQQHRARLHATLDLQKKFLATNPSDSTLMHDIAYTLFLLDYTDDALEFCMHSVELDPAPEALTTLAHILTQKGHTAEAIKFLKYLIKKYPGYTIAHYELALIYLAQGDWQKGWKEYEFRPLCIPSSIPHTTPRWDGVSAQRLKILVWQDQSTSDTLMCMRYLKKLSQDGATVFFYTNGQISPLAKLCPFVSKVIDTAQDLLTVSYNAHVPLSSLPFLTRTQPYGIFSYQEPYLAAHDDDVKRWAHYCSSDTRLKIGFCYQAFEQTDNFLAQKNAHARSLPREYIQQLSQLDGVSLYCLHNVSDEDREDLKEVPHLYFPDFPAQNSCDLKESAALIKNMDIIISVDSPLLHLSGALGVTTYGLLHESCSWNWLTQRTDTPWYSSVYLMRQHAFSEWSLVIQELKNSLKNRIVSHQKSNGYLTENHAFFQQKKQPIRIGSAPRSRVIPALSASLEKIVMEKIEKSLKK